MEKKGEETLVEEEKGEETAVAVVAVDAKGEETAVVVVKEEKGETITVAVATDPEEGEGDAGQEQAAGRERLTTAQVGDSEAEEYCPHHHLFGLDEWNAPVWTVTSLTAFHRVSAARLNCRQTHDSDLP